MVPPKGAPNVLLIMTDDAGFAESSTFGGVIPTPALDRIAQNGLRYTNFNSTALCSPTRAALITGRNHHSAGLGVVAEQSTGFPGYDSIVCRTVESARALTRSVVVCVPVPIVSSVHPGQKVVDDKVGHCAAERLAAILI